MKKQQKHFFLLVIALIILVAAFFGLKQYNKVQSEKEAKEAQETEKEIVVAVDEENILRFTYDYEGQSYIFEKEGDVWYYAGDRSLDVNENLIRTMLIKVAPLEIQQTISGVTDMEQYGLATPARTIQYETDTESIALEVGSYNSIAEVYYIRKAGESDVYTVSSVVVEVFNKTLDELVVEESTETAAEETDGSEGSAE